MTALNNLGHFWAWKGSLLRITLEPTGVNLDCPRQIAMSFTESKSQTFPWVPPLFLPYLHGFILQAIQLVSNPGVTEEADLRSREFAEVSTIPEDRRPREAVRFSLNSGSTCRTHLHSQLPCLHISLHLRSLWGHTALSWNSSFRNSLHYCLFVVKSLCFHFNSLYLIPILERSFR